MKIGMKRLLKLAKILDAADALHRKRGEPVYDQLAWQHACGSPACALGHWAANNKRRGWRLAQGPVIGNGAVTLNGERVACWSDHVQKEFGVSQAEGVLLFSYAGCGRAKTAKDAAKYIRNFVKRKERELSKGFSANHSPKE